MQASHHSGLHYVPSFNDLNTNSADDADEDCILNQKHNTSIDLLEKQSSLPMPTATFLPEPSTHVKQTSNKMDNAWGAFETTDIHKVWHLSCGLHYKL
jgi:hypothetical protein